MGALNMYSGARDVFAEESVVLAETFAGYAAVAIANTVVYRDALDLAAHLHRAIESRAVIEQATGTSSPGSTAPTMRRSRCSLGCPSA